MRSPDAGLARPPVGALAPVREGDPRHGVAAVRSWARRIATSTLAALVAIDIAFLVVSLLKDPPGRWETSLDRGYLEIWGYAKLAIAIALAVTTARAVRQRPYAAIAVVLAIILVDDAIGVHEHVGRWIVDAISLDRAPFGLRPFDIGQLAVWVILAALCCVVLWWGARHGDTVARSCLVAFVVLLVVLFVLAVGVDVLRVTVSGRAERAVAYLEDGGEQILISAMLCLTLAARRRADQ